jgi:hypothetical protein
MKKIFGAITISVIFLSVFVSAQSLKIDDFSIKLNGGTEVISVKKDGKVSLNGKPIGVLQADGKLKDLAGKTVAQIDETGKVTVNDKPLVVINKKGELDNGSGEIIVWAKDGKFKLSESQFLTASPNNKTFYQPASFLIFLYLSADKVISGTTIVSREDEKFTYKDSDLVAGVTMSGSRGRGYSIKVFGDGTITQDKNPANAKKVISDKKQIQANIILFLQRAEKIDFESINKKIRIPLGRVYDGSSKSIGVWQNGVYQGVGCSSGSKCPQEIQELHSYFFELFVNRK